MNLPKPSQNPSLTQPAQEIALTFITPSKSQQPLAYHLLDEETASIVSFQQIPNQESSAQLPANQHIINDPNQPLTLSSDLTKLEYHELHLAGHQGWWLPVLGILTLVSMFYIAPDILLFLFKMASLLTGENPFNWNGMNPVKLLYLCLTLASLIPISYFLNSRFHGLRLGWTDSVECRFRWCWLFVCFGLSIASVITSMIVSSILMPPEKNYIDNTQDTQNIQIKPNGSPSSTTIQYAVIILFFVPLQAAGEEFAFRGYLTQAFSALFSKRWRWMGILIPAILFAMAHGFDQTLAQWSDRFLCGLGTGILVILTGGLEAGIAMHAVNNMLIITIAVALGNLDQAMEAGSIKESQWLDIMAHNILKCTIYVVSILCLAPRHNLQTKVWKSVVRGKILSTQGVPVLTRTPQEMVM